jgi:hypothetical protein
MSDINSQISEQIPSNVSAMYTCRRIPSCPIERKSVVLGSIWRFKLSKAFSMPRLVVSKIVERFGKDDTIWEEVCVDQKSLIPKHVFSDQCELRDPPTVLESIAQKGIILIKSQ